MALLTIRTSQKTKLLTADCLVACRLNLYYMMAAQVRRNSEEATCNQNPAGYCRSMHRHAQLIKIILIAERLSARHVIAEYCVEIVCLYIYMYIYMSRLGMRYGEAHTVVLYARVTRAAIARPRDCTFFHNYSTFFHNSTTKWTIRLPFSLSMHRPHQRYCD